ncbi:MAG: ABC transporter ATP-binding protein [Sedimentibacter sp.]|uniref:ABC transporter ATP-binding protein n=1 Tax=Sedimentibacter sp. TaxID=1960295 RepID=UPI0031582F92
MSELIIEQPLLNINGLKTHFFTKRGVVPSVDGVSIEIPAGKIIGIVGESGCGKSVTSLSVMGLVQRPGKVVEGTIEFEGKNLLNINKTQMRKIRGNEISMIFQEPMTSLNPVYTVGRQVSEALTIHENIDRDEAKKRVIEIFESVGIPEAGKRFNSYPHQLSGGLRQRIMIGMAMICSPKLMIADEPTTALDVTIEAQILHLMRELRNKNNTSIMMITHNLGVVAEICDYVYVMYAGKVMEQAEVNELFDNTLHPYTDGLLRSMPRMNSSDEKLYSIKGVVPNLMKLPKGCRFSPRCERATERCLRQEPELYRIDNNHSVRCFLYESGVKK